MLKVLHGAVDAIKNLYFKRWGVCEICLSVPNERGLFAVSCVEVFLQARLRGRLLYVISSHCSQSAHEPQGTAARVNYFTNDPLWENQAVAVERFPNLSPPLILPLPSSPPRHSSHIYYLLTSFFPSPVFTCFCDVQMLLHYSLPITCSECTMFGITSVNI